MRLPYGGNTPNIGPEVFVAPNATIIGDVEIGEGSSVWYQTVIRGDVFPIRIGKNTNIQDLSMIRKRTSTPPQLGTRRLVTGLFAWLL